MIRSLDVGVSKSNESGSQKSLILNDAAHERLWTAIKKEYGSEPNISKLSRDAGLAPKVIRKIRDRTNPQNGAPSPVSRSSLDRIFSHFNLDLDLKRDCEEVSAPQPPPRVNTTQSQAGLPAFYYLREALQDLNYRQQDRFYSDFVDESCDADCAAGIVLICGEASSGQRWLVNRLIRAYLPEMRNPNKIPIYLRGGDVYIQDLWQQLGDRLLNNRDISPSDLVETLYKLWQQDHVVLVIHDFDRLPAVDLHTLFESLWLPLIKKISTASSKSPYRLLFFLIDNLGDVSSCGFEMVNCAEDWTPEALICLPSIEPFRRQDVQRWIDKNRTLPNLLPRHDQIEGIAERVWKRGRRGVPELTMKAICDRIDSDRNLWFEIQDSLEF